MYHSNLEQSFHFIYIFTRFSEYREPKTARDVLISKFT